MNQKSTCDEGEKKISVWPKSRAAHVVLGLLIPSTLTLIAIKAHRHLLEASQSDYSWSLWQWIRTLRFDFVFLAIGFALCWVFLSVPMHPDRRVRRSSESDAKRGVFSDMVRSFAADPVASLLGVTSVFAVYFTLLLLIVVTVVEHVFFVTQGAPLDGYMLLYSLQNLEMLWPVIASEWSTVHTASLSGVGAFVAYVVWMHFNGASRRRISTWGDELRWERWTSWLVVALGLLVGLGGLLSFAPTQLRVAHLDRQIGLSFLSGIVRVMREETPDSLDFDPDDRNAIVLRSGPETKRHNVVFIVLESTRAISVAPFAAKSKTMPFLEELAGRGAWAKRMYVTVPHTTKALVSIICGIYPKVVPGFDEAKPSGIPQSCLAELLGKQGYSTAFFQTAKESFEHRHRLVRTMGFEHFQAKESYRAVDGFDESSYLGYEDNIMIEPTLEWVDKQKEPFFLTLLTLAQHHKYQVPKGFDTKGLKASDDSSMIHVPASERRHHSDYRMTLAYIDRLLERVFGAFEARGLIEDTIFVLVGDHGEGFGEHGRKQHDNVLYEEGARVPFVILGPGIEPEQSIDGLRQLIDIVPTLVDKLGLTIEGGELPGKSVFEADGHDEIAMSCWYDRYCMALVSGSKKLIWNYHRKGPELFDLSRDPLEKENLIEDYEAEQDIAKLVAWRERANAPYQATLEVAQRKFIQSTAPRVSHQSHVEFDLGTDLIGYGLSKRLVRPGETTELALHFHVKEKPGPNWRVFVHVTGPKKKLLRFDHEAVFGSFPSADWKAGDFIDDRTEIRLSPDSPAGRYRVLAGLWNTEREGALKQRAAIGESTLEADRVRRVRVVDFHVLEED